MKKLVNIPLLILAFLAGPLVAQAGTSVDQGMPGVMGDWPIATAAHVGGKDCRVQVSNVTPTQMTCGITGSRKSIAIQNNGPNMIHCGFTNTITSSTAGIFVPALSNSVPGSWSGDLGLSLTLYCIADTAAQVSPSDTGVAEVK